MLKPQANKTLRQAKMPSIIASVINAAGEWLVKLLPLILSYRKGKQDAELSILKTANTVIKKQNEIASEPCLSRAELMRRLHDGEL